MVGPRATAGGMEGSNRGKERRVSSSPQTGAQSASNGRGAGREAPTEPTDYGVINLAYFALLGGVITATRRPGADTTIPAREIMPLGLATFALSKVIAREKIGTWVRDPFVHEDPEEHKPGSPRGRRLRHAVGELLTCPRCVGAWAGLGLVSLRMLSPSAGRVATTVLATSGVNDFLHAGFRLTAERANAAGG